MGAFDNYKIKLLNKKTTKSSLKRNVCVLPIADYYSILIIQNKANDILIKSIESIFKNSKVTQLYSRTEKEVPIEHNTHIYTYHISDLGFGKIKKERLLGLVNTNFDLVIDFSDKITEFNYFIKIATATLKIGDLHSTKNYLYDLLVDKGSSDSDFLDNIKLQINTLSQ